MLQITDLRKAYGSREVLRGVDLTVTPGQIVGLVGANGAGKTTLISIAAGLRPASSGSVRLAGVDVLRYPRRAQRHLGLAPQELGIYPTLTVADNFAFFARLAGLSHAAVRARVAEVADALGLAAVLEQRAGELSGGQKRRLHTGMAVLHQPDVLFLDESTVGADVQSRAGILDVVRRLAAAGAAVVYTTHYLAELEQLEATVAILHEGRIVATGSTGDLIARFASAAVHLRFDGPAPALPGWDVCSSLASTSIAGTDAAAIVAHTLAALGEDAHRLTGIDIVRPSLEHAYLALTGRPLIEEDSDAVAA